MATHSRSSRRGLYLSKPTTKKKKTCLYSERMAVTPISWSPLLQDSKVPSEGKSRKEPPRGRSCPLSGLAGLRAQKDQLFWNLSFSPPRRSPSLVRWVCLSGGR